MDCHKHIRYRKTIFDGDNLTYTHTDIERVVIVFFDMNQGNAFKRFY